MIVYCKAALIWLNHCDWIHDTLAPKSSYTLHKDAHVPLVLFAIVIIMAGDPSEPAHVAHDSKQPSSGQRMDGCMDDSFRDNNHRARRTMNIPIHPIGHQPRNNNKNQEGWMPREKLLLISHLPRGVAR